MRPLVPNADPLILGGVAVAVLVLVLLLMLVRLRRARRRGAAGKGADAGPEVSTVPLAVPPAADGEAVGPSAPVEPVRDPGLAELPARYHALLRRNASTELTAAVSAPLAATANDGTGGPGPAAPAGPARPTGEVTPAAGPPALRALHPAPANPGADARDRLLAVLLDDPGHAVQAVRDLQTCERQLDRLSAAVRHERAVLSGVLRRLSAVGLDRDQLTRLTGLPAPEISDLLAAEAPEVIGAR